jgi:hypothetical protein
VDVVADLPTDTQAAEVVQERERGFRHPPVDAKARAVSGAASGDLRGDAQLTDPAAVAVVVLAAVGPAAPSCRRCQTPGPFQSRSRRQQVMPEPKPNSCGRNSQRIPV